MNVTADIDFLEKMYFYFDEPVVYNVKKGYVKIKPVSLRLSEIFLSSFGILTIDKNAIPNPKIIQMSYLRFLYDFVLDKNTEEGQTNIQRLSNILKMCLELEKPSIKINEFNKLILCDKDKDIEITEKQFDEIKKILLYQNILHYDDEYINPEMKEVIQEMNELKNKDMVIPSLERKMAIITAHTGLSKKEQENMTYRSHCLLFEEVCGETEFITVRPAALMCGSNKMEHWIYKKKKEKLADYVKSVDSYTKSMGGGKAIKSTSTTTNGESYLLQYNNFNK